MKFLLSISVFFLLITPAFAKPLTFAEIGQSVCRITSDNEEGGRSIGTGTIVEKNKGLGVYYILTNAHVAKHLNNEVDLDFYENGQIVTSTKGKVIWLYYTKNSSIDIAIISVPIKKLRHKPRLIRIAKRSTLISPGQRIYGAGYPSGNWLQYWEARVISNNSTTITFNMPPVGGQSGSGVFADVVDSRGEVQTRIVGLLTWSFGDSYGGGLSLERIYQVLYRQAKRDYIPKSYHIKNKDICRNCDRHRDEHYYVIQKNGMPIMENGKPKLFCPGTHSEKEIRQLGTGLCPGGNCYPPKPPSSPPQIFPNNDFEEQISELNEIIRQQDEMIIQLREDNKRLGIEITTLEQKLADALSNRPEPVAPIQEEKGFNLPFLPDFGKLGNIVALVAGVASGGGVMTLGWHHIVMPFLVRRIGWVPAKIIGSIASRRLDIQSKEDLEEKLGLSEKKNENLIKDEYNIIEQPTSFVKDVVHPYVKSLFEQGNGSIKSITPKEWAVKKGLYEQALALLKDGALTYKNKKVENYEDAAYAVEEYVRNRFYNDVKMPEIHGYDGIENDGYIGYLYYQAIEKLKVGNLETFSKGGYYEAAMSVEQWVKDKTYYLFRGK